MVLFPSTLMPHGTDFFLATGGAPPVAECPLHVISRIALGDALAVKASRRLCG